MRLDKFLSHSTGLPRAQSRREIQKGFVTVDDNIIKNAAFQLTDNHRVYFQGKLLSLPSKRYLMMHKPKQCICANSDAHHQTVFDVSDTDSTDLSIAGRLDLDTTGLVLLSDDGQWIHRVISPNRDCQKIYRVTLAEPVTEQTIKAFKTGILLKDESKPTKPAILSVESDDNKTALVTISEGRYHQVKRMFAACGNHVVELHREQIGSIQLDPALKAGEYRSLTEEEIKSI